MLFNIKDFMSRKSKKEESLLNSDDLSKGLITVKDNITKEEVKVPEDEIIDYILGVI